MQDMGTWVEAVPRSGPFVDQCDFPAGKLSLIGLPLHRSERAYRDRNPDHVHHALHQQPFQPSAQTLSVSYSSRCHHLKLVLVWREKDNDAAGPAGIADFPFTSGV